VSLPKPNAAFGGRKVFLSHASTDRAFVLRLVKILKQNQVSFWYSETDIQGAKQWHDEIGRALTKCNWFLLVLTPNSIHSPWVKRELLFALEQKRYNEKIIPLLYKSFPGPSLVFKWSISPRTSITDAASSCGSGVLITTTNPLRRKPQIRKRRKPINSDSCCASEFC